MKFTLSARQKNFGDYSTILKTFKNLIPNTDYLLFKHGIKPEWEDPKNNDGGKWVITIPKEKDMVEE